MSLGVRSSRRLLKDRQTETEAAQSDEHHRHMTTLRASSQTPTRIRQVEVNALKALI